jgi:hypothetical protein
VYEVQARVQALKKKTASAPEQNNDNKQQNRNTAPDDSGRPQPENYSREMDGSLIAQGPVNREGAQL